MTQFFQKDKIAVAQYFRLAQEGKVPPIVWNFIMSHPPKRQKDDETGIVSLLKEIHIYAGTCEVDFAFHGVVSNGRNLWQHADVRVTLSGRQNHTERIDLGNYPDDKTEVTFLNS